LSKRLSDLDKKLTDLDKEIEKFKNTKLDIGKALKVIRDKRLYRETHKTFEKYLRDRWDMDRKYGYYLIEYAEMAENVNALGNIHKLEPEKQKKVWKKVLDWSKSR